MASRSTFPALEAFSRRHTSPNAKAGLQRIVHLCAIEERLRSKSPATRQVIRWTTESAPLVNRFSVWLDEPHSRLGAKPAAIATSGTGWRYYGTTGAWQWTRTASRIASVR